jgi:WD40 repeat protein
VQDTRRRVRPDELKLTHAGANEVQQVLKTLADTRLVTTDDDEIQVAHEALIRNWDTLREWLADDREGNRIQRRLTEAANQWVEFGKDANLLYRGMLLQQAQEWMTETINPPNQIEMSFLQTSQTAVEAAAKQVAELAAEREANRQRELEQSQVVADTQRRRVKTFRWAVVITMVLTVIAAVAAIVAIGQRQIARAGELAANAKANLDTDPELSLLLAQSSLDMVYTPNGEVVLRQALQKSRIEAMLPYTATEIMQMSIQPDHKAFLTSDKRGILEYRSSTTGELLYRYTTNQGEVNSIVFAPKHHNLIAFGTLSGTISLLDLDSGDMNQLVLANPSQITSIAFTPDETGIIFGRGKYIEHWNRNTNQLQQPQIVPDVFVIRFSPDQRFVVIGTWSGEIIIWDAHLGNKPVLSWQGHKDALAEIVFSRDGRSFATAGMDRVIKLWAWPIIPSNSNAPRLLQEFTGHYSTINSIAFSPNDKCLASASNDQKVILWDTLLSKELASFAHQDPVYAVIFAENSQKDMTLTALPCGGRRLTTIDKRGTIRHWNLGPTFEYAVLPLSDQPINSLAVSPDRRFMAAAGDDGKVYLLDPFTKTNPILQKFSDMPLIVDLDFHMDGKWLATASEKGSATLWNISESASDPIIFSGLIDTEVLDVEFRPPDGQQIATISSDRKLRLWETSTAKLLGVFPLQYNPVALAFDTDGDNLIVGNRHRQAIVIETAKMITVTSLQHDNTVSFVEFSPNSDQFVTGDTDGNVTFHSFSSANEAQRRSVHSGPLYEADFSPNGRLLVTTGGDGKIVIWDVAATRPQSIIQEEPGLIYDVKFINTPDGLGIAAAGSDGTVRFYLVVIDALKAFAQTRITRQLTLDECNSYFNQGMCRN